MTSDNVSRPGLEGQDAVLDRYGTWKLTNPSVRSLLHNNRESLAQLTSAAVRSSDLWDSHRCINATSTPAATTANNNNGNGNTAVSDHSSHNSKTSENGRIERDADTNISDTRPPTYRTRRLTRNMVQDSLRNLWNKHDQLTRDTGQISENIVGAPKDTNGIIVTDSNGSHGSTLAALSAATAAARATASLPTHLSSNSTAQRGSEQVFISPKKTSLSMSYTSHSFDEDSVALDAMCQRFNRIFTTGDSYYSADVPSFPATTPSMGDNETKPSVNDNNNNNNVRTPSAVQVLMDHQYAQQLAEQEITGQNDSRQQVHPQTFPSHHHDGSTSRGTTNTTTSASSYRHQALWMATAQLTNDPMLVQTSVQQNQHQQQDPSSYSDNSDVAVNHFARNTTEAQQQEDDQTMARKDDNMIEVSPGVFMSLVSAQDTWKAIQAGRIIVSTCLECQDDLTCVEGVGLVVCGDCWTVNIVDQRPDNDNDRTATATPSSSPSLSCSSANTDRLGLGVKNHEIVKWIENGFDSEQ